MKVKGIKKLNREVTKIISNLVGFKVKCKVGDTWISSNYSNKVWFSPIKTEVSTLQEEIWAEWCETRYNWKPNIMFMFSILHEVGHLVTLQDFMDNNPSEYLYSEDIEKECDAESVELCKAGLIHSDVFKKVNLKYFSNPMETIATDWAQVFYRTNLNKVEKAYIEITWALKDWYEINDLQGEE